MFLDQDDFALMSNAFSDASQIALLIRPVNPGSSNAGIFMWEDGDIDRRTTAQLFPFDSAILRLQEPIERPQPVVAPRTPRLRRPRVLKPSLGWSIAAVAGVALVLANLSYRHTPKHEELASIAPLPEQNQPQPVVTAPTPEPVKIETPVSEPTPAEEPDVVHAQVVVDKPEPPAEPPRQFVAAKPEPRPPIVQPLPPVERAAAQPAPAEPIRPLASGVAPAPSSAPTPDPAPVPVARVPRRHGVAVQVSLEPRHPGHRIPVLGRLTFHSENPADFSPARPNGSIEPRIPQLVADDLSREVSVDVKVSIDKHGSVKNAEPLNGARSELASLAADTAQAASWEPAHEGERSVSSDVIVHYRFRPRD
jgi:hypothetical protein